MSVELTTHAVERSTYILDAQFSNASGTTFVPTTVSWTLSNRAGTDQNGRTGVSATAATTVTIVLSGSDLTLVAGDDGMRIIYFEVVYNSATYGNNLKLKEEANFIIDSLVNI